MDAIKKREINFEYLRIFSMILIIMAHYAGHGGVDTINDININRFIGSFLTIGGKLGVNLFILISGYFLINSKFKMKKIIKLELQVLFYSILLLFVSVCIFKKDITINDIIKSILPTTYSLYWFLTAYIGMYLLTPFVNKLINNIDKKSYKALLCILLVTVSIIPTLIPNAKMYNSNIILFIFIYLIAGYIKKYDIYLFEKKNYINIILATVICIGIFLTQLICICLSNKFEILQFGESYLRGQYTLPMIIVSVLIFMAFRNLKFKDNVIILNLAKCSFGVYLIHDNPYFKDFLWKNIFHTENFYYADTIIFILHILISVFLIYIVGTIIELIRINLIEKNILKINFLNNLCNRIDEFIKI